MEEIESENIVLKDDHIFIYIPVTRYYLFACGLLMGAILLIGSYLFLYFYIPTTFHSFWSRGSLIYLGLVMLAIVIITYEFLKLRKRFKSPQMLICNNQVYFKQGGKGSPVFTDNYISLKYKDIISADYAPAGNCQKSLTLMTETRLYPVPLILQTEEEKMVYDILRSKLADHCRRVNRGAQYLRSSSTDSLRFNIE